jgi:hypothetical protein
MPQNAVKKTKLNKRRWRIETKNQVVAPCRKKVNGFWSYKLIEEEEKK